MMPTLKISSDQDGKRLDIILSRAYPDYSRSFLQKWIKDGRVTQSGHELIPNYRVHAGETIDVADPSSGLRPPSPSIGRRQTLSYPFPVEGEGARRAGEGFPSPSILFEDASILVLNKPAALVVHPAPSHKGPTLVDWLEDYLGPKVTGLFSDSSRLGVVHRLDKDTTGVLLVAKTPKAQNSLSKQFQNREVKKTYAAFLEGVPKARIGIISAPVGRSHNVPSRMAVTSAGRPSETSFEIVKEWKGASLVSLHPKTGRTHQIRVHCAAIGHPIIGDRTYGSPIRWSENFGIERPLLHAERLEFAHPETHKKISVEAPWPKDMKRVLTLFTRSLKMVLVGLSLLIGTQAARAQDSDSAASAPAPKPVHTASAASSSSQSSIKSMKREMAALHTQFKSLIEEVSALEDRVTGIQSSLDELGAANRLRDLEKAISDLNAKAVNTSNVTEDTKSQMLDLTRKLKTQQDAFDQMRDQLDRLQQEVIQAKAHAEEPPAAAPAQTPQGSGAR